MLILILLCLSLLVSNFLNSYCENLFIFAYIFNAVFSGHKIQGDFLFFVNIRIFSWLFPCLFLIKYHHPFLPVSPVCFYLPPSGYFQGFVFSVFSNLSSNVLRFVFFIYTIWDLFCFINL